MRKKVTCCFLLVIAFLFINTSIKAQYQAGPPLRVDFQSMHRIVLRTTTSTSTYLAGAPLRIDFEVLHRKVDRVRTASTYVPGPALRVDFQSLHRIRRN